MFHYTIKSIRPCNYLPDNPTEPKFFSKNMLQHIRMSQLTKYFLKDHPPRLQTTSQAKEYAGKTINLKLKYLQYLMKVLSRALSRMQKVPYQHSHS